MAANLSIVHDLLKKAQSQADEVEIFAGFHESLKVDVLNQKVEAVEDSKESGIGIRLIKNKKLGFAFSSILDTDSLDETLEQALAAANNTTQDDFLGFPASISKQKEDLDIYDSEIPKKSIQDKINLALEIEKQAYAYSPKVQKTEKISYGETEYDIYIANSHGIDVHYKGNSCGLAGMIIATQNGEMEMGLDGASVSKYKFLNAKEVGQNAARKAVELLGAKLIPSGKMPVVLDPEIGTELLDVISSLFSADAVQKGKSLLRDRMGQEVASSLITIIDNGRMKDLVGTSPYDGEGIPTGKTTLVQSGKLNSYLYNTYTANKDKVKSTGNAARASFSGQPLIGTHNLYFEAGKTTREDLLKGVKNGLYITRLMGLHTINPISGEFSVGAEGIMIENGQLAFPVKGITIAGDLLHLLEAIEVVGSDLKFFGSTGSPTLLVGKMSVSGK